MDAISPTLRERDFMRISFRERHLTAISAVSAAVTMAITSLGLYFTFRWLVMLSRASFETREALLGQFLASLIESNRALLAFGGAYLVYGLALLCVKAADYRAFMRVVVKQHRYIRARHSEARLQAKTKRLAEARAKNAAEIKASGLDP